MVAQTHSSTTADHVPPGGSTSQPASMPRACRLMASVVQVYGSTQNAWRCGGVNTTMSRNAARAGGSGSGPPPRSRPRSGSSPVVGRQAGQNVVELTVAETPRPIEVARPHRPAGARRSAGFLQLPEPSAPARQRTIVRMPAAVVNGRRKYG